MIVREVIKQAFDPTEPDPDDPDREARRQSLLVSGRDTAQEDLDLVDDLAEEDEGR